MAQEQRLFDFGGDSQAKEPGGSGSVELQEGKVLVEESPGSAGVDGEPSFVVVDKRNNVCSVHKEQCKHVSAVHRFVDKSKKDLPYELTSALHKSIRMSDPSRSRYWGNWMMKRKTRSEVLAYAKMVVLEETRSMRLMEWAAKAKAEDTWPFLRSITRSVKKWELNRPQIGMDMFRQKIIAHERSCMPDPEYDVAEVYRRSVVYVDLMEALFRSHLGGGASYPRKEHTTVLVDRAEREVTGPKWFMDLMKGADMFTQARRGQFYHLSVLIECLSGVYPYDQANEEVDREEPYAGVDPNDESKLLLLEPCVYDNHSTYGKKILANRFFEFVPGKPEPGKLDMRWSGDILSVLWRNEAFRKFGKDYRKADWEDVEIDKVIWDRTILLDRWWYETPGSWGSFYHQIPADVKDKIPSRFKL